MVTENDWFFDLFAKSTRFSGSAQCPVCGKFAKIIGLADQGGIEIGAVYIVNCKTHGGGLA